MKGFWSKTRPNGQPVEPGTVCWITDLEDGSLPIPTYGKTVEEVTEKLALQNAHAQAALARKAAAPRVQATAPTPVAPPVRTISPDQVMRATQDLENPAKAGEAIVTLVEAHTGMDLHQLAIRNFGQLAMEWQAANPDFDPHPGNKRLLAIEAQNLAGGNIGQVTRAHLDQAYANLKAQGILMEGASTPQNAGFSTLPPLPDESQVQREKQRPRFSTGVRSSSFQRQTAHTRTLKYTEEQIRKMPMSKSQALIESGDRDYAEACEYYYGSQQASA